MRLSLKKINYRGILSFEIPKNWIEEYDDDLGGTFYKNVPTSGTLRLKVISFNITESSSCLDAADILNKLNSKESELIKLPNKNAYKMFSEETIDSGYAITIYYWNLVQIIQPNKARLANFSYTILSDQLNLKSVKEEIEFITSQVESAKFNYL